MMWMLSASSARRWSRRRSVVTSGVKATVDIKTKKPGILSRASFQLFVFLDITQTAGPLAPGPMGSSYNKRRYSSSSSLGETLSRDSTSKPDQIGPPRPPKRLGARRRTGPGSDDSEQSGGASPLVLGAEHVHRNLR